MDCHETKREIHRYIDGEMHVWQRVRVRAHLQRCPNCQGGHDFELDFRAYVKRSCVEHPPSGLKDKIRRALDD